MAAGTAGDLRPQQACDNRIPGGSGQPPEIPALSYTLDADDAIVAVAGDWDRLALANGCQSLLAARIIGRRLDDFITGDVTRMFVRTMLMSARTLQRAVCRPYRCDSPQVRRLLQMSIVPQADDRLDVRHWQLRQEPVPQPVSVVAAASGSTAGFIKRCSMCNRIRLRQDWVEVGDARNDPSLAGASSLMVVYGVCPDCLRGLPPRLHAATPAPRSGKRVAPAGQ
ncbi:hypothetical protein [Accumulibacter sp.]|uniref:hypothetical protein n=1 Tax=Accumulibacter sp. TaxID=2053492 RepID=UPI0025E6854B|nr:hypothetical protein [Accumulibacter sp.]MCM8613702.1 hypothetical protein [Accumulibacter sp.]MCM8637402.1 hypothetical protein [Accumulibacter sp.]MCM8640882.1 hypothetical protein [Accumulibacter sp.]